MIGVKNDGFRPPNGLPHWNTSHPSRQSRLAPRTLFTVDVYFGRRGRRGRRRSLSMHFRIVGLFFARRLTSQRGAGGGGSMGHSRWRALRGYLIWSQKRLRTAAARKPGTRQMISSTDLNPAEAAVCKSREDPTAVRHGRPGLPCTQLDCAACVKAHKRAAWGCARACFSPALLATA